MDRRGLLEDFHPSKPQYRALSSSGGEVGVLDVVVQTAPGLLAITGANRLWGGALGTQPVGDDGDGPAVAFHRHLDEYENRGLFSRLRDEGFQHLTFVVDGTPQVAHLAADFHADLIQAPLPAGKRARVLNPFAGDPASEHRSEPIPPTPHRLRIDVATTLEQ